MRLNRTLLLIVLAALVLGCGRQPGFPTSQEELKGMRRAVSCFHINLPQQIMSGPPTYTFTGLEASTLVRSELELLLSDDVIGSALNTAEVSQWDLIPDGQDRKTWVRDRLFVDKPAHGRVEVALVDPRAPHDAMVAIVQAMADTYQQKARLDQQARVERSKHGENVEEETARQFEDYTDRLIAAASMVNSEGAESPYLTTLAPRFDVNAERAISPGELLEPILCKFEYWDRVNRTWPMLVPTGLAQFLPPST